jgi:hypothetical protein
MMKQMASKRPINTSISKHYQEHSYQTGTRQPIRSLIAFLCKKRERNNDKEGCLHLRVLFEKSHW